VFVCVVALSQAVLESCLVNEEEAQTMQMLGSHLVGHQHMP
jgi:hypothetical protein